MNFLARYKWDTCVNRKLWNKFKGRHVEGWSYRTFCHVSKWRRRDGFVTYTCYDRSSFGNMTEEKLAEIDAMIALLKETT